MFISHLHNVLILYTPEYSSGDTPCSHFVPVIVTMTLGRVRTRKLEAINYTNIDYPPGLLVSKKGSI